MSRYLEILAVHSPRQIGSDSNNRVMFSLNFDFTVESSPTKFEEEVAQILFDADLGELDTNIFVGPLANIPSDVGPYISLISTGGISSLETHNGQKYSRPSMQIVVRALDYVAARDRANDVYNELNGKRNITIIV